MSEPNLFVRDRSCFDGGTFLIVTDVGFTGVLTSGFTSGWNVLTSGWDGGTSGCGDLTSGWLNFAPWLVNKPRGWITPDFRPIRCWACWFWICWLPAGCCWLVAVPAACDGAVRWGWGVFPTWENGSFSYLPKYILFYGSTHRWTMISTQIQIGNSLSML